jgi:hypothetical protein
VVNLDTNHVWTLLNVSSVKTWVDRGIDTVQTATNALLGLVKGTSNVAGNVFVNADGSMYVTGFNEQGQRIDAFEGGVSANATAIEENTAAIETNATAIEANATAIAKAVRKTDCATEADVAEKMIPFPGTVFGSADYVEGARISVKFGNGNTAANPTLMFQSAEKAGEPFPLVIPPGMTISPYVYYELSFVYNKWRFVGALEQEDDANDVEVVPATYVGSGQWSITLTKSLGRMFGVRFTGAAATYGNTINVTDNKGVVHALSVYLNDTIIQSDKQAAIANGGVYYYAWNKIDNVLQVISPI